MDDQGNKLTSTQVQYLAYEFSQRKYCAVINGCISYLYDRIRLNTKRPTKGTSKIEQLFPDLLACVIQAKDDLELYPMTLKNRVEKFYNQDLIKSSRCYTDTKTALVKYTPVDMKPDNQLVNDYLPVTELELDVAKILEFLQDLRSEEFGKFFKDWQANKPLDFTNLTVNDLDWQNLLIDTSEYIDDIYSEIEDKHAGECSGYNCCSCTVCNLSYIREEALGCIVYMRSRGQE